ncbi:condensation domain-containing protein, partial [Nocardioides hankookensis]
LPAATAGPSGVAACRTVERVVEGRVRTWVLETARRLGVTPMVVVLAAWEVCLSELDEEDHVVMMPVSVRGEDADDVVGALIETLPVVSDAVAAEDFDDLVLRVWRRFVRMIGHRHVPFARLLSRPGLSGHLSRYLFSWQEAEPPVRLGGTDYASVRLERTEAIFHLALECAPTADGYLLRVESRDDGVPGEADRLVDRLVGLLDPASTASC